MCVELIVNCVTDWIRRLRESGNCEFDQKMFDFKSEIKNAKSIIVYFSYMKCRLRKAPTIQQMYSI
jgi:hypothetical protein